jgi:membrane associated rhomboid family serine protease
MPPVTAALIVINVAVFVLQTTYDDVLVSIFALWPFGRFYVSDLHTRLGFRLWQLVSYAIILAEPTLWTSRSTLLAASPAS